MEQQKGKRRKLAWDVAKLKHLAKDGIEGAIEGAAAKKMLKRKWAGATKDMIVSTINRAEGEERQRKIHYMRKQVVSSVRNARRQEIKAGLRGIKRSEDYLAQLTEPKPSVRESLNKLEERVAWLKANEAESISEFIMDKARLKTLPPRCQGSVQRLMCSNGVKEALERLHAAEADSEVEAPESTTVKTDPTGTEGLMARPPPGKQEAAVADDGQLADTDGDGSGSMTGNGEGDSDDTDAGEQRSSDSRGGEDSDDSSDDDGEGEESDGVVEARAGLGAALKAALAAAQERGIGDEKSDEKDSVPESSTLMSEIRDFEPVKSPSRERSAETVDAAPQEAADATDGNPKPLTAAAILRRKREKRKQAKNAAAIATRKPGVVFTKTDPAMRFAPSSAHHAASAEVPGDYVGDTLLNDGFASDISAEDVLDTSGMFVGSLADFHRSGRALPESHVHEPVLKKRKKNRPGQMARQKLAEVRFKDKAKHKTDSSVLDANRNQLIRKMKEKGAKKKDKGDVAKQNPLSRRDEAEDAKPGKRRRTPHQSSSSAEEYVHPSWAAQKSRQNEGIIKEFKGTKITFD